MLLNTQTPHIKNRLKIIRLNKTTSTNDYAYKLGQRKEKEIIAILAKHQTKGKGRRGRKWSSPKNKGIYVSFLFQPKKELKKIPLLGLILALATVKALKNIIHMKIKWPNDLVIGNKKIGGILLETKTSCKIPEFVVVGLGLNINAVGSEIPSKATSLFLETAKQYQLEKIINSILKEVIVLYQRFKEEDYDGITKEVINYLDTIKKKVTVHINNTKIRGIAYSLGKYGTLLLKDSKGKIIEILASQITCLR